jgi:hypothetical protein
MGWASKQNGELLHLAEGQFDVFLTVDRNLSLQQDVTRFGIGVVVMVAKGNRYADLKPLVGDVQAAVSAVGKGQVLKVIGGSRTNERE